MCIMSIENPTLAHFRHFSSLFTKLPSTTVENSLQITPFYAKQSQFQKRQNEHNFRHDKILRDFIPLTGPKNKPNSKPIQTQFNPKQTQFKPNKAKNKPNFRKGKNERFCADKEPYNDINNATRGSYHPIKGANSKPISKSRVGFIL